MALLTHFGQWVQPPRRQDKGPAPKPRWMPLPGLLYAQVIKTVRRRRLVRVRHRVVFGTLEAVQQGVSGLRLADQHGLCGAPQPHDPPACGRRRPSGEHALQRRGWLAAATRLVPSVSQLLSAACQLTPSASTARTHPSRLDAARGAVVSRAAVAAASGGVNKPWWWEVAREGGLRGDVRLHGRLRGRHHGAEGCSDAMRALSSRPFCPCNGRRVSLWYLSAGCRYTARLRHVMYK